MLLVWVWWFTSLARGSGILVGSMVDLGFLAISFCGLWP